MSLEKIKQNVTIDENQCWNWNKSCSSSGYGQFTLKGKYWNTHVYVYTICHGPILPKQHVRHKCHNTKCCNPDHLVIGSAKDNYNDSKDIHAAAQKKRRHSWNVNGVIYPTFRDAVSGSGISANTINKYTINGVFDVSAYREACKIAKWTPKV